MGAGPVGSLLHPFIETSLWPALCRLPEVLRGHETYSLILPVLTSFLAYLTCRVCLPRQLLALKSLSWGSDSGKFQLCTVIIHINIRHLKYDILWTVYKIKGTSVCEIFFLEVLLLSTDFKWFFAFSPPQKCRINCNKEKETSFFFSFLTLDIKAVILLLEDWCTESF